jgi:hypothetical protein
MDEQGADDRTIQPARTYVVGMRDPERLKIWLIAGAIIVALALAILTGTGILPGEPAGPIPEDKFGR